jgi:hypothetical protein
MQLEPTPTGQVEVIRCGGSGSVNVVRSRFRSASEEQDHYTQNSERAKTELQSLPFSKSQTGRAGGKMNWKSRFLLGVFTALAMMAATYLLPRGGAMRDASLVQFPMTVGVWAIFVLLFVKLK